MMNQKIRIEDHHSGFAIFLDKEHYYHIDQEEPAGMELVKVFEALGYEVEYEEVY